MWWWETTVLTLNICNYIYVSCWLYNTSNNIYYIHTLLQGGKSIPAFWVNKAKHSTALHSQTSPVHQTTLSSRSRNQSQSSNSSQQPTSYGLHSKSSTPGLYQRSTTSYDLQLESGFQLSSSCWTCQQHHGRKTSATKRWRSTSAPVLSGWCSVNTSHE